MHLPKPSVPVGHVGNVKDSAERNAASVPCSRVSWASLSCSSDKDFSKSG